MEATLDQINSILKQLNLPLLDPQELAPYKRHKTLEDGYE